MALIGASPAGDAFSHTVASELRNHGYEVVPVNPKYGTVDEATCYAGVGDVPGGVDGAIVMVPLDAVEGVVDECIAAGIGKVWLFQGIGRGSADEAAVARCRAAGVDVVPGACPLMFLAPVGGVHRFHRGIRKLRRTLVAQDT